MEERSYTAADLKALGLSLKDMCALRVNTGYAVTFYESKDCSGAGWGYAVSNTAMDASMVKKYRSCTVAPVTNAALEKYEIYGSINDANAWKANDGAPSAWTGDAYDPENLAEPGTAWLYVDLDEVHTIPRYVLKNAGYAGQSDAYNTRDFQLQYSLDGTTWVTVDTVTGNTASQVSRNIQPITARYFRLLITTPNSSTIETERGAVTVAELELYGVPAGLLSGTDGESSGDEDVSTGESSDDENVSGDQDASDDELIDDDFSDEDTGDDILTDDTDVSSDDYTDDDTSDESSDDTDGNELSGDNDDDGETGKKKPVQIVTTEVYFPWWGWVLIGVAVVAAGGVVVILMLRRKKKQQAPAE